ncbi:MAG: hypothetical protein HOQ32_04575 [Lysobacter sp.]|nr:hypothetical protein [Lysobacter sp.]
MAILILGKTQCPLCSQTIEAGQVTVSSPHFIHNPSNPLWRYSDAAMHYECFQPWERRAEFVAEYNRTIGEIVWGNGDRHRMQADGTIVTTAGLS